MTGDSIVIDTNVAVGILNGVEHTVARLAGFSQLLIPVPVLGELYFGATNSGRVRENLQRMDEFVATCQVVKPDQRIARRYANIRFELARKGRPIPENDLWIAATTLECDLALATFDRHFREVAGLSLLW